MKKIKLITALLLIFLSLFLYLDNKSYYYGFGKGYISSKLPYYIRPHYRGSDLGNTGFSFVEKDVNLDILDNLHPTYVSNNNKIIIKKILGYGFDKEIVIVKIEDSFKQKRYVKIYYEKNVKFSFDELKFMKGDLKYINLDKSLYYFNNVKMIKNIVFLVLCILFFYLVILGISKIKLHRNNSR